MVPLKIKTFHRQPSGVRTNPGRTDTRQADGAGNASFFLARAPCPIPSVDGFITNGTRSLCVFQEHAEGAARDVYRQFEIRAQVRLKRWARKSATERKNLVEPYSRSRNKSSYMPKGKILTDFAGCTIDDSGSHWRTHYYGSPCQK